MSTRRNTFSRVNQPVTCRGCGKRTTSRVRGVIGAELCAACLDNVSAENTHNDEHITPVPGCRFCPTAPAVNAVSDLRVPSKDDTEKKADKLAEALRLVAYAASVMYAIRRVGNEVTVHAEDFDALQETLATYREAGSAFAEALRAASPRRSTRRKR